METKLSELSVWWIIVFVAFWFFASYISSLVSGWQRLAAKYRAASKPLLGKTWSGQYGMVGLATYRGVLNIGISPAGLFLSVMPLFRVGHPDLLIPWQDIARAGERQFLFISLTNLDVGKPRLATLQLPSKVMNEAVPYLYSAD